MASQLQLILNVLNILSILLIIFGLVFYFVGYKLIRVINLIVALLSGYFFGYFMGWVFFMSDTMGVLLGGLLGLIFAFFAFFYYKYLKGFMLGGLAFIWGAFTIFSVLNTVNIQLIFAVSLVPAICTFAGCYKYEKITTMLVTSLLGSTMLLHSFFGISGQFMVSLISILLGIGGLFFQLKIVYAKSPKII